MAIESRAAGGKALDWSRRGVRETGGGAEEFVGGGGWFQEAAAAQTVTAAEHDLTLTI